MVHVLRARIGQSVLALLFLSVLIFAAARATGDPATALLPLTATAQQRALFSHQYGLDRPLPIQYLNYVARLVRGDLGTSVALHVPVTRLIAHRIFPSFLLVAVSTAVALLFAVIFGMLSAVRRGRLADSGVLGVSMICQSMPVFWVGIISIQIFAVRLRLLPSGGFKGYRSLVLPSLALALFGFGSLVRLFRSSAIEVLSLEHVSFARLKGLSDRRVLTRHVLRNALMPVITAAGIYLAGQFSMSFALEAVFNWPGLGQLGFAAIQDRDYPVLQGVVLVTGVFVILVNLVIDVLYAVLDARVRV